MFNLNRFHEEIQSSLEKRKADVIELSQNMSASMQDIHEAIIACMTTTLNDLKRSNTSVRVLSYMFRIYIRLTLLAARFGGFGYKRSLLSLIRCNCSASAGPSME